MQVKRINDNINFTGKIIYPEKLTPEIEKFKSLAHERISQIIQNEPYDIYVKSKKTGDKVDVRLKSTDKQKEANFFFLYILYEAVKSAKDKMLLEEVKEFMEKSIIKAETAEELILKENIKPSRFIPRKIGSNREISSHPKFKTKHSKRN
jgi:hypothetical protein